MSAQEELIKKLKIMFNFNSAYTIKLIQKRKMALLQYDHSTQNDLLVFFSRIETEYGSSLHSKMDKILFDKKTPMQLILLNADNFDAIEEIIKNTFNSTQNIALKKTKIDPEKSSFRLLNIGKKD